MNCIDPDGQNCYYVDSTGHIFLALKCEKSILYADDPNNSDGIVHMDLENDDIMEQLRVKDYEKAEGFSIKYLAKYNSHKAFTSSIQAQDVYNFLQANTKVEWGFSQDRYGNSFIATEHLDWQTFSFPNESVPGAFSLNDIELVVHSHPKSGPESAIVAEDMDMKSARKYPNARYYMISHSTNSIVRYNSGNPCIKRIPIINNKLHYDF